MNRDVNIPYDEGRETTNRMTEAQERLAGLGGRIREKATHLSGVVSQQADRQRENAARGLDRAASGLQEGMGSATKMAHGVADSMKSTASYLRTHTFGDMSDDVINACRRHPAQALISAVILGFVAGRLIRR
jgi:methyl-accepting chemotaxis protein